MEVVTNNENETKKQADVILNKIIKNRDKNKASVITLSGELGSGKTAFVKGVAEKFKIKERVLSPTYIIERSYKIENKKNFSTLIHIDAYRLTSDKELCVLNWEENIKNPENIICIEWPENVEGAIPKNSVNIFFTFVSENKRLLKYYLDE